MNHHIRSSTIRRLTSTIITIATALSLTIPPIAVANEAGAQATINVTLSPATPEPKQKAETPPSSPDVTIKDELTEDEASITNIKINQMIDGTAPFDNDDQRGDDSSASNRRIRSFDRVTYLIEATTTSDDPMTYYRKGRIGYKITIPVSKDKAIFNYGVMGWVDQTKGYEPKVTDNPDGSQTLTVYKRIEPTDEIPTVIPGVYEVPIIIDVKAMHEDETLQPTFEAWTSPNNKKHRTAKITADPIAVTSIPKYDIDLATGDGFQSSGAPNQWDFGRTDPRDKPITASDGLNKELGVQKGIINYIRFGINMRWSDSGKQLRGLEIPRAGEPLKISIDISNTVTKNAESKPLESDARLQPYLWATNSHYGYMQGMRSRETLPIWRASEWSWSYPYFYNESSPARVYNGGDLTIDQKRSKDKTTLDVTIKNWEVDPNKFPRGGGNYGQCGTLYSTQDCTIRVAQFSQGAIYVFTPTQLDGKDLGDYYGTTVSLKQHIETSGIRIMSETGDVVTQQEDPLDAKGNPTNNVQNMGLQLYAAGGFSMQTWYACSREHTTYNSYGTECSGWAGATFNGTDKATIDSMVRLHMENRYTTSNTWGLSGVFSLNLAKIDDKLLEVPEDLRLVDAADWKATSSGGWWNGSTGGRGNNPPIVRYATKPDGAGWASDVEQSNAMIDDLRYWDTLQEAKSHGIVVGFIIASRETGGVDSNTFMPLRPMIHVKNDPNNIGKTAQFTQVAESWTRQDLIAAGVTPKDIKVDSPKTQWDAWTRTIDPMELRKTVKPTYHADSKNHYRKSTYDSTGHYIPGTEGMVYGDTILVAGEKTTIGLSTEQQKPNNGGIGKTLYDLDNGQRYVDWLIKPKSETLTGEGKTDHKITVTIPKGLSYVTGSSSLNGGYVEQTPNPGKTNDGDKIEPVSTVNADGTTTLIYDVPEVLADGKPYGLHLATYIGDPSDPDNDAQNGQQYMMTAQVMSTYDITPPNTRNQKAAQFTIQVSRTRANQLATRALTLINDTNQTLSFKNMISNSSSTEKTNVWAVDLLPWNGVGGSSYRGDHKLTAIDLKGAGVSLAGNTKVYAATDPKYRDVLDPSGEADVTRKITGDEIAKNWTEVPMTNGGKVDLSAINGVPTGFAIHLDRLNPKARLDVTWSITPKGNSASDVYGNRWSDLSNTVTALTSIADREVNGVVWWDENEDGIRQSNERRLQGVKVEIIRPDGSPVIRTDGSKAETVTDANGRWKISKLPAGAGYKAMITPSGLNDWTLAAVTLKKAKDVQVDRNSDADSVLTFDRLRAAEISLADFPTVDQMKSSRYVDSYEDTGLRFANFVQRSVPNAGSRDLIILVMTSIIVIGVTVLMIIVSKRRTESK